jgi:branched-chain amino acid aminotransferase
MSTQAPISDIAYFDSKFVPLNEANINIKTHAFLYGTSIFEGIRGYYLPETDSVAIFRLKEHMARLLESAHFYFLTPPHSVDDLCNITVELVKQNQPSTDIYIRPTLYKTGVNITPRMDSTENACCIWVHPLGNYLDTSKGLKVCVSSWRRLDDNALPPRAKAGANYLNTALMVTDSRNSGFDDAIALNQDGTVSEGSAMNLFLIRNNILITPGKTDNILEGITRDTLITLAKNELGLVTEQRPVDRTELYRADEAFFCGTGAQVAPISSIDHRTIGKSGMGPITQQLQALYFKVVRNQLPQYSSWVTMVNNA